MSQRYILCMKWGDKYPAEYVNRLYRMVKRHLSLPFTMVCLTDNDEGIDPAVRCLPIPSLNLPDGLPERGWLKLTTFTPDLHGLQGTALFLDLDVVIMDNIDHFFTHQPAQQGVFIIRDWKRPWRKVGNSSVYRFELGAYPELLEDFRARFAEIRQQFRNEQAYLSWYVHQHNELHYWPSTWCKSYKYHALRPLPLSLWLMPKKPDCDILIFHGEVNPHDAITGGGGKWYRHILPAPWLKEYW
ncbi:glycosyltransferase [Suttonella sp. R2A3]|uniref:glycosyltransferase n=1 Tax=Suttonella sp. R2A3 TaxID=2908648 RepID=UPI001F3C2833|nr:glycosyltransferase [Suttonella sp. R2A3]UJF23815.1 glycosyltransferase [Suttonella sp. R2A3]